jgi:LysM repeat protein
MVKTLHARAAATEKDFEDFDGESEPNMKFSHALIVVLVLHILAVGGVFAFNALKGRHVSPERAKPAAAEQAKASAPDVVTAPAAKTAGATHEAPAAPAKAPAKGQPEAAAATYTVVAGDTLTRIAAGHKTTVEALEQANGIGSNSALRIGQVLKIPAKAGTAPATPAAKAAEAKAVPVAKGTETKAAPVAKSPEVKAVATPKSTEAKAGPAVKNPDAKPTPFVKAAEAPAPSKPAAGEAPKADAQPSVSDKSYTVAKGDNPYSIAKKLKVSYNELIKANNIQDPTKLQIGQKLIIP